MSPDSDPDSRPDSRLTDPSRASVPGRVSDSAGPTPQNAAIERHEGAWKSFRRMMPRLLMIALSAAGMFLALGSWLLGHPGIALRVVAGDVLLLLALLLLAS